jgi:hypothetical protein
MVPLLAVDGRLMPAPGTARLPRACGPGPGTVATERAVRARGGRIPEPIRIRASPACAGTTGSE